MLVTLDTRPNPNLHSPFVLDPNVRVIQRHFEILDVGQPTIRGAAPSTISFRSQDRVLSVDDGPQQNLNELIAKILDQADPDYQFKPVAKVDLAKTLKSHRLWLHVDGGRREIQEWPMTLQLSATIDQAPMSIESAPYQQDGIGDPLAWLSQASWNHDLGTMGFSIVVRRLPSGEFALMAEIESGSVKLADRPLVISRTR